MFAVNKKERKKERKYHKYAKNPTNCNLLTTSMLTALKRPLSFLDRGVPS
jgi:hypothetical protein